MKQLHEYETPECDEHDVNEDWEWELKAQSLEQRLGAAREALEFYADTSKYTAPKTGGFGELFFDWGENAQKTLDLIKPQ